MRMPSLQILIHRVQHRPAQFVFLQQVTEPQNGALVRRRRSPQVDAHKPPQGGRFIQRILRPRVAQIEPLLQKVHPQHDLQSHRRPSVLPLGIVRFHQRLQLRPWHHLLHLLKKPSRFDFRPYFSKPVCAARVCCRTRLFPPTYTLPASPVDQRVLQRFPKSVFVLTDNSWDFL